MYSASQTSSARRRARNSVVRAVENAFEPLESRKLYSVTASAAGGVLNVLGDNGSNAITVSRDLAGNVLMIWNNGDGSDINEGGDGIDTTEVNGGAAGEQFTANAVGTRVLFQRSTQVAFSIDIGGGENLVLHAGDGDDNFRGGIGLA